MQLQTQWISLELLTRSTRQIRNQRLPGTQSLGDGNGRPPSHLPHTECREESRTRREGTLNSNSAVINDVLYVRRYSLSYGAAKDKSKLNMGGGGGVRLFS